MLAKRMGKIRCILILLILTVFCLLFTVFQHYSIANTSANVVPTYLSAKNGDPQKLRSEMELRNVSQLIAERKKLVNTLCKEYHLGRYKWSNNSNDLHVKEPPTPLYSYFFWNRGKKLAWCPVYKAGSTSWLKNMVILAGFDENLVENPPKQLSIWAREVYGDPDNFDSEELRKSTKLLVVRHPFERLLSAYRDKLANSTSGHEHGTHHFYLKYGKRIVQKFRRNSTIHQIEPTWPEFVRYILKTDLIQYADDHWLPAYYSCTPCLVNYDIIAKTETYFQDQKFIIQQMELEKVLKPRWSHSTANNESKNRLQLAKHYFSQLTKHQIEQLYEKYKLDFLLFGYTHEKYLQMAKDSI